MLEIGSAAPAFSLPDHAGTAVTSDDLAGQRWLLYWYPKADTPGCVAQAQGLRDLKDVFDEHGCRIVGASFDPVADIAAFREKYGLNFTLLSDEGRVAGPAYEVAGDDGSAPFAQRIAYLVDPAGNIENTYVVDDPEFFAERVLDDLEGADA